MKNYLFLFFLAPSILIAQNNLDQNKKFIANLASYRNELIADNFGNYMDIVKLDTLWKMRGTEKESVDEFLGNIIYANEICGVSPEKIIKRWDLYDLPLPQFLSEENINIVTENNHLLDLLTNSILKPDPPFQISPNSFIFEELSYYEVENGMRIAEIGAGSGVFSLMLGLAYESLDIYVNDLSELSIKYAQDKTDKCNSKNSSNNYHFITGEKKSTSLENVQLDKIFIRNSFHHFSKKDKMLLSIKASLIPDGDLYIFDPILESGQKFGCRHIISKKEIVDHLNKNGFKLIDEKHHIDWGWSIFHCKPKNEK